jgi:integrase
MPRRAKGPRLYFQKGRGYVIRDGPSFIRIGGSESEAQQALARYIAAKYTPEPSCAPLIADVLLAYLNEHVPHTRTPENIKYTIKSLSGWWGDKSSTDVTARNCRAYAATKSPAAARRDLETLRAALKFWHREYGPMSTLPAVVLPPKSAPRQRWLTRSEAARLLWAARRTQHLKRFILLALYTGSRSGVILRLQWDQLDLSKGVMARIRPGTATSAKKLAPPVRIGKRIISHLRRWQRLACGTEIKYLCHYEGVPVTKLRRSWKAAAGRAGLEGVSPHTLRHTRATWLMQDGVDPWEAAGSLGMSVEMIQRTYGHHHPDFQRRASEV